MSSLRTLARARVLCTPRALTTGRRMASTSHGPSRFSSSRMRTSTLLGVLLASAAIAGYAATREPVRLDAAAGKKLPLISAREVQKHNTREDCWIVIQGNVYDLTQFMSKHPGGPGPLLQYAGKDATEQFLPLHPKGTLALAPPGSLIGVVDSADAYILALNDSSPDEREEVRAERRAALPPVAMVQNLKEFEELAARVLGEKGKSMIFYRSVAEDGSAFKRNLASWSYIQFRPRVLVPVDAVDTSTTFLKGEDPSPFPFFISPAARAGVGHPDGERTLTRGAAATGVTQCISTAASIALDDIFAEKRKLAAAGTDARTWYQLYVAKDPKVTEAKVREAVNGGCTAILVTVDLPVLGKRENDPGSRAGLIGKDAWSIPYDADMTFDVIPWLKSLAPGVPILIKGVATPEDTELAMKAGAAGVVLSNHGGRQLDGAPPPLATLVRIRQTKPELLQQDDFSVLLDGGVRRGSDVLKALCIGARGVGLGRPFLYAQTCYGEKGVERAIQILEEEIQINMRLIGAASIKDLKPSMVELLDGLVGKEL